MSQYWIIPAFMHRNATKREKKTQEKKRLGNGKIEMSKGKLKCRQRLNLQALKSLFYKWICSSGRPDNCALRSVPPSFTEGVCSTMCQVAKTQFHNE